MIHYFSRKFLGRGKFGPTISRSLAEPTEPHEYPSVVRNFHLCCSLRHGFTNSELSWIFQPIKKIERVFSLLFLLSIDLSSFSTCHHSESSYIFSWLFFTGLQRFFFNYITFIHFLVCILRFIIQDWWFKCDEPFIETRNLGMRIRGIIWWTDKYYEKFTVFNIWI